MPFSPSESQSRKTVTIPPAFSRAIVAAKAADRLGISSKLIYCLCAARKLRHERFGLGRGCIRIAEEALQAFRIGCTKGENEAASEPPPVTPRSVKPQQFQHLKL